MYATKEVFKKLLYGPKLESIMPIEKVDMFNKALREWIKDNIPNRLYRYREFNTYNLEALIKDEIWGSSISTFNDPFECMPCYDLQELVMNIHNGMDSKIIAEKYAELKNRSNIDDVLKVFEPEDIERIKSNLPDVIEEEKIRAALKAEENIIMQFINSQYMNIVNDCFLEVYNAEVKRIIACFSEVYDSSLMWGHYADSHRGFCIGYNFEDDISACDKTCENPLYCMNMMMKLPIAPVVYSDTRYDASSTLLNYIIQHLSQMAQIPIEQFYEDFLFILKCLLTKSTEWSYEKEWRMFANGSEFKPHAVICNRKPTAVYIGCHMSDENAGKIYKICQDKDIACYKMVLQYYSKTFTMQPVLYEKYLKNVM